MRKVNYKIPILLFISTCFLCNIYAQKNSIPEESQDIVIYAKVIFIEDYTDNVNFGVRENKSNYYRMLLEVIDTNVVCYKKLVVSYSGCLELKKDELYNFLISKKKSDVLFVEEKQNDTVYKTNITSLPKRMTCNHKVLSDIFRYEYYFFVKKVW